MFEEKTHMENKNNDSLQLQIQPVLVPRARYFPELRATANLEMLYTDPSRRDLLIGIIYS